MRIRIFFLLQIDNFSLNPDPWQVLDTDPNSIYLDPQHCLEVYIEIFNRYPGTVYFFSFFLLLFAYLKFALDGLEGGADLHGPHGALLVQLQVGVGRHKGGRLPRQVVHIQSLASDSI